MSWKSKLTCEIDAIRNFHAIKHHKRWADYFGQYKRKRPNSAPKEVK
jgi:hypothetical protein